MAPVKTPGELFASSKALHGMIPEESFSPEEELSIFMHRVACGMCALHDRCTVQEPASCSPIITVHALLKNVNGIDIDCSCATIELLSCKELPVEIIMSASADGTFSIFADSALASELLHGSGGDLP